MRAALPLLAMACAEAGGPSTTADTAAHTTPLPAAPAWVENVAVLDGGIVLEAGSGLWRFDVDAGTLASEPIADSSGLLVATGSDGGALILVGADRVSSFDADNEVLEPLSVWTYPLDMGTVEALAYDPVGRRVLMVDWDIEPGITPTGNFPEGVDVSMRAIDVDTGEQTTISGPGRGDGPAMSMWWGGIVVDQTANVAFVAEAADAEGFEGIGNVIRILEVDLATGDRRIVATEIMRSAAYVPNSFPDGLAWDPDRRELFVGDQNQFAIYAVDVDTGDHRTVSGPRGTQGGILDVNGLVHDPERGTLFAVGSTAEGELLFETGVHRFVLEAIDPELGSGTVMWSSDGRR